MVLVSAMHITAGVYVNDWEDGLIGDFQEWLEKLAPAGLPYRHHQTGEDNADAHLKRTIMGHQVIVPITAGKLDLGPWEQVFYAEFDGQRRKRVIVKVMGRGPDPRCPSRSAGSRPRVLSRAESRGSRSRGYARTTPQCIAEHVFTEATAPSYQGRDVVVPKAGRDEFAR